MLSFHLAGINNQNFIMRDEETGSYWQQISGLAISGPLKGCALVLVHSDELSFGLWSREQPLGRVLDAVPNLAPKYEKKDWEAEVAKLKTVISAPTTLGGRELIVGIRTASASRAFPYSKIKQEKLIADSVGGLPVIIVLGPDNVSIRGFENHLPSKEASTDFYRRSDQADFALMDSASGSEWDFRGCAVSGPAKGSCLTPVDLIKDYWFDWAHYNPSTSVYSR